jgi:hypothetical protein
VQGRLVNRYKLRRLLGFQVQAGQGDRDRAARELVTDTVGVLHGFCEHNLSWASLIRMLLMLSLGANANFQALYLAAPHLAAPRDAQRRTLAPTKPS